jgi:hypothetical protein
MAVLKANYVKKGDNEKARAKATIKYIEHRPGKDHEQKARTLFGIDGPMARWQAYRMIDDAPKGRYFYRVIINPDPVTEDKVRDLPLRKVIEETMQTLQAMRKETPIQWVAAIHDDHSDKRHIHALAIVKGKLNREELGMLRDAATQEAQLQREALNVMREVAEYQQEREEALWLSY